MTTAHLIHVYIYKKKQLHFMILKAKTKKMSYFFLIYNMHLIAKYVYYF